jgi:hypothetical protein
MTSVRHGHTATVLDNGKVLVTGGDPGLSPTVLTASAELFDPAAGTFSPTGSMNIARQNHTATRTASGKILIAGGDGNGGLNLSSAEIYDPSTGKFTSTGTLQEGRTGHSASVLPDGSILLTGGALSSSTAERFVENK